MVQKLYIDSQVFHKFCEGLEVPVQKAFGHRFFWKNQGITLAPNTRRRVMQLQPGRFQEGQVAGELTKLMVQTLDT